MTPSPEPGSTTPLARDMSGALLGDRYELGAMLGEGGMGTVYLATDTLLDRSVAVKVFRDGMTEHARTASETRLLASVNHPALVTLFDAHVAGETPRYIVMEYVDGPTLQSRLDVGPLAPRTLTRIARDLGEALHVIHQAGIVHRDVKPANILLRPASVPSEEFQAKLADFGIAYLIDATRLTTPGTVIGSAAYLSPEQVRGESAGPASDIYSLGLVLLEAHVARRAFAQGGHHEVALARLSQDPVIPASVGTAWGSLLTEMTARDPSDRPSALDVVIRVGELGTPSADSAEDRTVADGALTVPDGMGRGPSSMAKRMDATTLIQPDATAVLPERSAPETAAPATSRPRSTRWLIVVILALLVAVAIASGVMLSSSADDPAPEPTLPALEEPLGTHLDQLLDSVSP